MHERIINMAGGKYGRITALAPDPNDALKWLCRCDCGTEKSINGNSLRRGLTRSCGIDAVTVAPLASGLEFLHPHHTRANQPTPTPVKILETATT